MDPAAAAATDGSARRVVIVGGGFAGLNAARRLGGVARCEVTLLDRSNHHLFQPLLYQVAMAGLSPAEIAAPIRALLSRHGNVRVLREEVHGVELAARRIATASGALAYDVLVLACGAQHAYFGHEDWAAIAPGLKSIEDATELRRRILLAFESAEYEASADARRAALTFAIVGAGPTGVELAGAIMEIAGQSIPKDYKHIDTRTTRVLLFEGGPRILPAFIPALSARAQRDLERMGVEVRVNAMVTQITAQGISIGDEFIAVRNVFWAAGVKASALGQSLGVPLDHSGRVIVGPDLSIPDHPEVFVAGDMAAAKSAGQLVPGVAQAGIQMGQFVGTTIANEVRARARGLEPSPRPSFVYRDKGQLAVIGKAKAVAQIGGFRCGGFFAWLVWGGVHIAFLIGFRNRLLVLFSWFWNWMLNARDARLITGDPTFERQKSTEIASRGGTVDEP